MKLKAGTHDLLQTAPVKLTVIFIFIMTLQLKSCTAEARPHAKPRAIAMAASLPKKKGSFKRNTCVKRESQKTVRRKASRSRFR